PGPIAVQSGVCPKWLRRIVLDGTVRSSNASTDRRARGGWRRAGARRPGRRAFNQEGSSWRPIRETPQRERCALSVGAAYEKTRGRRRKDKRNLIRSCPRTAAVGGRIGAVGRS